MVLFEEPMGAVSSTNKTKMGSSLVPYFLLQRNAPVLNFSYSIGSIYYRQHNKQLVIMVLQRHVSTHTSHRQVTFRTFPF
jgi:hypothetical protein